MYEGKGQTEVRADVWQASNFTSAEALMAAVEIK